LVEDVPIQCCGVVLKPEPLGKSIVNFSGSKLIVMKYRTGKFIIKKTVISVCKKTPLNDIFIP